MKKILIGLCVLPLLTGAPLSAAMAGEPEREAPASASEPAEPAPPPRAPKGELGFFLVPWGGAYLRSALGASFHYEAPLIKKPGVLWDSTNITVGVRDIYGWVNNALTPYVEITPIAVFKLQVSASYEVLILDPFDGGLRTLTPLGQQRLAAGQMERGNPDALDWVTSMDDGVGQNNRQNFTAPVFAQGFRPRIAPTLQAKLGPVAAQYNFAVDFNFYHGGGYGADTIYHDSLSFTLRKMRDAGFTHEGILVFEVPGIKDTIRIGAIARYYRVVGTGLDRLETVGLLYYKPGSPWVGETGTPWFAGQFGTNPIDPMHQWDFNWVLALGLDFQVI